MVGNCNEYMSTLKNRLVEEENKSLNDGRVFTTGLIVISVLALCLVLILFGEYLWGDTSKLFGEGRPGTYISVLLLLLISFSCFKIYALRSEVGSKKLFEPKLIWLLMAFGFFFLALDDAIKIHENIEKVVLKHFELAETAVSDRLDDVIIALYAAIGAGVLYICRSELRRYKFLFGYLLAGFAVLFFMIVLDLISNGLGFLLWLGASEDAAELWETNLSTLEEVSKVLAGAIFLSGFLKVQHAVSDESKD